MCRDGCGLQETTLHMCVTIIIAGRLLTLDLRFRVLYTVCVSSAAADSLSYEWLIISSS